MTTRDTQTALVASYIDWDPFCRELVSPRNPVGHPPNANPGCLFFC